MSHAHVSLNRRRWAAVRRQVFDRDRWRCVLCGRAGMLECDHVAPLRTGGDPWDMANLQTLCRGCHIEKSRAENTRPDPARDRWRALVSEIANG